MKRTICRTTRCGSGFSQQPLARSLDAAMLFALALTTLIASAVRADLIEDVTVDTSSLPGSGSFVADFELPGDGDGNDMITISLFKVNGTSPALGTAGSLDSTLGISSFGDLSSTLTITDNGLINDFYQPFTPGASLSFQLDLTATEFNTGSFPDTFSFSILNANTFVPVATTDPSGFDSVLFATIDSSTPTLSQYALVGPAVVPEPSTLSLLATGFLGLAAGFRWRRKTS